MGRLVTMAHAASELTTRLAKIHVDVVAGSKLHGAKAGLACLCWWLAELPFDAGGGDCTRERRLRFVAERSV